MTKYKQMRVPEDVHKAIKKVAEKSGRTIISQLRTTFAVKTK